MSSPPSSPSSPSSLSSSPPPKRKLTTKLIAVALSATLLATLTLIFTTTSAGTCSQSEGPSPLGDRICWRLSPCRDQKPTANPIRKPWKPRRNNTAPIQNAPEFVLKYAPYVYLHSEERFHPGDIAEHLIHTTPHLNLTPLDSSSTPTPLLLSNLEKLNALGPEDVYLTSNDDPTYPPPWLRGNRNIPDHYGKSKAPAIIIWTEKSPGVVDVFYFYFYSFNLGNTVAGWRFGNHVGDWEHTAIRFIDGSPLGMFFSEHSSGKAYQFSAVEKLGNRPITYSATGSHANYATPGTHYYAIPFHLLFDRTDKGYLWDPVKNNLLYHYDIKNDELTPDGKNPEAPVSWFHFEGKWGDMIYPLNDRRQYRVVGQYHYVNGPTGPKSKNLDRREICQNAGICTLLPSLKETSHSGLVRQGNSVPPQKPMEKMEKKQGQNQVEKLLETDEQNEETGGTGGKTEEKIKMVKVEFGTRDTMKDMVRDEDL